MCSQGTTSAAYNSSTWDSGGNNEDDIDDNNDENIDLSAAATDNKTSAQMRSSIIRFIDSLLSGNIINEPDDMLLVVKRTHINIRRYSSLSRPLANIAPSLVRPTKLVSVIRSVPVYELHIQCCHQAIDRRNIRTPLILCASLDPAEDGPLRLWNSDDRRTSACSASNQHRSTSFSNT